MDVFRKHVERILRKAGVREIRLEEPPGDFGDLAFPCFALAKQRKRSPAEVAAELGGKLRPGGFVKEVKVAGPYLNFFADWSRLGQDVLAGILKSGKAYGSAKGGKSILLEHTSANPDGPLHVGHLRNAVIGDSLARILGFTGNRVKTEFYVNDAGRQITIAVLEYMKKPTKPRKPGMKSKLDWWVLDMYVKGSRKAEKSKKFNEEVEETMRKFEAGDRKLRKTYSLIVDACLKGHKETMKNLGMRVDGFTKESKYIFGPALARVLGKVRRVPQGRLDGKRLWVDLKKFGIEREFTLTRSDGTSIYPARDIAYHEEKLSRAQRNINVIGTDQKFYFRQLTSVLGMLFPRKAKDYTVVFYEFLLLPGGSMSTRSGKFMSVDGLLEKSVKQARKTVEEKMPQYGRGLKDSIAKAVGVGALKYAMVKVSPEKTYSFRVEDALSFEGDTAPYIQYTHARAKSILRKAKVMKPGKFNASMLSEPVEVALLRRLSQFPGAVSRAARDLRPHYIANYAHGLADLFNEFYQALPVIKAEKGVREARLALTAAAAVVLANALELLGIVAPGKM